MAKRSFLIAVEIPWIEALKKLKFAQSGELIIPKRELHNDSESMYWKTFNELEGLGLVRSYVASWGYQETGYAITEFGKAVRSPKYKGPLTF